MLEIVVDGEAEVLPDCLEILIPVWSVNSVDSNRLELHDSVICIEGGPVRDMGNEAWSQLNDLVKILGMELRFEVGKTIVHLHSTLGISDVENLIFTGSLLNSSNISCIVIETHISPGPVPVLGIGAGIKSLVIPTVHGASVVANPHIVTFVNQLQVEWDLLLVRVVGHP